MSHKEERDSKAWEAQMQAINGVVHTNLHNDREMQRRIFADLSNNIAKALRSLDDKHEAFDDLVMAALVFAGWSLVISDDPEDVEIVAEALIEGMQRGYPDKALKLKK